MSDAPHTYLLHEIRAELKDYEIVIADLPSTQKSTLIGYTPTTSSFKSLIEVSQKNSIFLSTNYST